MGSVIAPPARWPSQTRLELAAEPAAPGAVRGLVRALAREWGLGDLADTAELLASEIATNAVQASQRAATTPGLATAPVIRLWITSDGVSMIIHVWDACEGMPIRQDAGPDEPGGRGLLLVETLGTDWGAYRLAHGKIVWVLISHTGDPGPPRLPASGCLTAAQAGPPVFPLTAHCERTFP